MPKNIPLPIPLDRWLTDVKRVTELREILDTETFQTAAAILKEIARPSYGTLTAEPQSNSQRHAWYAGYCDALNDLHKLTRMRESKQPNQNTAEEWTHITTPQ